MGSRVTTDTPNAIGKPCAVGFETGQVLKSDPSCGGGSMKPKDSKSLISVLNSGFDPPLMVYCSDVTSMRRLSVACKAATFKGTEP